MKSAGAPATAALGASQERPLAGFVPPLTRHAPNPPPVPPEPKLAAPAPVAPKSTEGLDPTVLLVGAGEKFTPAFQAALARHRVFVETADPDAVVDAVVTAAPDLVLLMGEAARDCGNDLLNKLESLPKNFTVPVVILEDEGQLDARLRAFRHGATAVIPRSASVDATAERVAKLARELPDQDAEAMGTLGEATLEEFVSALSTQLRSELVSVVSPEADGNAVRLVLGRGRPLAEFMDLFVRRVRRHVLMAEPLRYELDTKAGPGAAPIAESILPAGAPSALPDLRVLLADDDTPRADAVAQELRARGAVVVVTDLDPTEATFQRLRQVDPTVLIMGEPHVHGEGLGLLRRVRQDTRLRWASQLCVRWNDVWSDETGVLSIQRFESTLAGLAEPEEALKSRALLKAPFDTRLEMIGPARCLRALAASGLSLRVTVQNRRVELALDLSDGLVVGIQGKTLDAEAKTLEGPNALSALLLLGSGRVHVEPVDQPATANVMAPVEVALNLADSEAPPISPSMPATGTVSIQPPFSGSSLAELVPALPPLPEVTDSEPTLARAPLADEPARAPAWSPEPAPLAAEAPPVTPPAAPNAMAHVSPTALPASYPSAEGTPLPAAKPAWRDKLQTLGDWYENQNERLHGPRVSPRTAAVLVLLAVLQAVALVVAFGAARSIGSWFDGGEAEVATPVADATQPPAATPAAKEPAPPAPAAPTPAVPAVEAQKRGDGSGRSAPSCRALTAADPPKDGYYPGAAQEQARLARAAIVAGDLGASHAAFCRAVHWDPKNQEILVQLTQVLLLQRDGEKALEYAERAVAIDPSLLRAQEVLGDSLARVGAEKEAREAWFRAARLDSKSDQAKRQLLGRELRQADRAFRRRDLVVAEKYFRRAAGIEPQSHASMVSLAYLLSRLGDTKAAVYWASRAVKVAPRNTTAHIALGDALSHANERAAAMAEWKEASLLDPGNAEAQKRLRRGRETVD